MKKAANFIPILLIIFLPLSAWLVSLTGDSWVALGRDGLLVLLTIAVILVSTKPKDWWLFGLAVVFIAWGLASYFWREESLGQWLRGVRFVLEPVVLFGTLLLARRSESWNKIWPWLIAAFTLAIIAGFVEYFFPQAVRYTLGSGLQQGNLEQVHLAGAWQRMQSTLAGPNALGLYLLVGLLSAPWWAKNLNRYLATVVILAGVVALALTFSRSSYIGTFAGAIALVVVLGRQFPKWRNVCLGALGLLLITGAVLAAKSPSGLIRVNSNEIRLEQYHRVWQERSQIGWLGRGIGSAGLVSQNRLDGGPNNYTENTYLDMFEALGLVGAILYLSLWLTVLWTLFRRSDIEAKIIGATGVGLFVAGIFVNHYTGQAALWTFMTLAGLALASDMADSSGTYPEKPAD